MLWAIPLIIGLALPRHANAESGLLSFSSASFDVQLVESSQTLYSLKPASSSFDFVPSDMMDLRSNNGNYHLGDITFRARLVGSDTWTSADSSSSRSTVTPVNISGEEVAAADLTPTLPGNSLLSIQRRWVLTDEYLELLFDVTNTKSGAVLVDLLCLFDMRVLTYEIKQRNRRIRFSSGVQQRNANPSPRKRGVLIHRS